MSVEWTQEDERRFQEMAARREPIVSERRNTLANKLARAMGGSWVDSETLERFITLADDIRDALAPFDSGVRAASKD